MTAKQVRLSELSEFSNGKFISVKERDSDGRYPVFGSNGVIGKSNKILYEQQVIVIGRAGSSGTVSRTYGPSWISDNCIISIPKKNTDFNFLFYNLKNLNLPHYIIGTSQPLLTQEILNSIETTKFQFEEEQKIGKTLYDLDTKIQNLQNQNHILEQTAQAIFQSWFVDFDGVTEFEDSELGKIPKGWSVEKINDICETFGGGTPSTKNPNYWNGQNHWLVPRDLTSLDRMFCVDSERKITDEGLQNCASQMHPEDSIFMTSRATIGAFCINKIPVATNQGFIVSRPKNLNHLYYIFLNFRNRVDEFIQEANGSTFLEISRGNFRQLPILVPSPEIIDDFQTKAKLLFENIFNNEEMIVGLSKTRDVLLPKLMSGEIRV